jgi:hypothetical protein
MSRTIAHRHGTHVHIPWAPVLTVAVAVAVAVTVLVLVNQPAATTNNGGQVAVGAAAAADAAVIPAPESVAARRHLFEQAALEAETADVVIVEPAPTLAALRADPPSPGDVMSGAIVPNDAP